MISNGLKKFAEEMNLTVENSVAYGWLKGCLVAFSDGMGFKRLSIYTGPLASDGDQAGLSLPSDQVIQKVLGSLSLSNPYKLLVKNKDLPAAAAAQEGKAVVMHFQDTIGPMKRIRAFTEEMLPMLAPLCNARACAHCGSPLDVDALPVLTGEGAVLPFHLQCLEDVERKVDAMISEQKPAPFLLPILGAVSGAIVGAVLWVLVGMLGYIAALVGTVSAFLSFKAYTLLGGKPGKPLLFTLILCMILTVCLGTLGGLVWDIHTLWTENNYAAMTAHLSYTEGQFILDMLPVVWQDEEVRSTIFSDAGLGLFFAALGCYGILRNAAIKPETLLKPKRLSGKI
ncbi:MAG: hypothetical protein E7324_01520 [Clostridiales bacterium]|nr:hypothetical protein [Clostridiales bacterium]